MARPRRILWVDDEVESLTSHVLFLEEQGFEVERTAHGDDALVLLQRQDYGVVLLDEQMPGRRGLELFRAIREFDHALPVVMVTKSEEPETLKDAIGAEISDYLVKPVNPRQILSVVTRLLEGDRIRQQRLSRDFATRFRELESRRGAGMGWREWTALVAELAEWEVRLGHADEPGLQEALRDLQISLRQDFAHFIEKNYVRWLREGGGDRPPLSVDVGAEFLVPLLRARGAGTDGGGGLPAPRPVGSAAAADRHPVRHRDGPLLLDPAHRHPVRPERHLQRPAPIGAGDPPPEWWRPSASDDASLNTHEAALLEEQLEELMGASVPVRYEKVSSPADGEALLRRLAGAPGPARGDRAGVQLHRPADPRPHREPDPVRGRAGYRGPAKPDPDLVRAVAALGGAPRGGAAQGAGAADHRSRLDPLSHAGHHLRPARRDQQPALQVRRGPAGPGSGGGAWCSPTCRPSGFPPAGPGVRLLLATGDRFFVYPTKLREYQARYRGAFLHGGVTPEEMILPISLLTPRGGVRG